jgi:hypothetical protein
MNNRERKAMSVDTMKDCNEESDAKMENYKDLLKYIVHSSTEIDIIKDCDDCGDVKFSVPMPQLGISYEVFIKYQEEIISSFFANFIGELLVRENIEKFAEIISKIDKKEFSNIVHHYEHKKFGVEVLKGCIIFSFHISLIQSILTEDFKKQINKKVC